MASTVFDLTDDWSATNRYTAAADVDIQISATSGGDVRFDITPDDTAPAIPAGNGHPVRAGRTQALQLKTGDRLWLVTTSAGARATLGVLTP